MHSRILKLVPLVFYINVSPVALQKRESPIVVEPLKIVSENDPAVWCKIQPNGYDCNETQRFNQKYYYDVKFEDCKLFRFGSCEHDSNKFDTLKECRDGCLDSGIEDIFGKVPASIYCKLQPDFGLCHGYHPKFYFDLTTRSCKGFSYSGCGGNLNRFLTSQDCYAMCGIFIDKNESI